MVCAHTRNRDSLRRPARLLLLAAAAMALTTCLADPRTDEQLRTSPEWGGSSGTGGPTGGGEPVCNGTMLAQFNNSSEDALASCFLPPEKCKSNDNPNGLGCVTKCLMKRNVPKDCAVCIADRTPCVLDKCKSSCLPSGFPAADKMLPIACPKCVHAECSEDLRPCTEHTAP